MPPHDSISYTNAMRNTVLEHVSKLSSMFFTLARTIVNQTNPKVREFYVLDCRQVFYSFMSFGMFKNAASRVELPAYLTLNGYALLNSYE